MSRLKYDQELVEKLKAHFSVSTVPAILEAVQNIPAVLLSKTDLIIYDIGEINTPRDFEKVIVLINMVKHNGKPRIALSTIYHDDNELLRNLLGSKYGHLFYDVIETNDSTTSQEMIVEYIVKNFDLYCETIRPNNLK